MLLKAASERANLATKIVASADVEARASKSNNWFTKAAADCDLELDDFHSVMDAGQAGGDLKAVQRLGEAKRARGKLNELLAKPMRKQHFGKFLGSKGAEIAKEVGSKVVKAQEKVSAPYVVNMKERGREVEDGGQGRRGGRKVKKSKKGGAGSKGDSRKKQRR